MSTSLLYHAFGVRGYRYVKTEYAKGEMVVTIELPRERYACSVCGSTDVIGRGQNPRRFRAVPIGRKPVYLALAVPRVECCGCGVVRQVKLGFADPRVSYTKAFGRYALELSRFMTIQDVADRNRSRGGKRGGQVHVFGPRLASNPTPIGRKMDQSSRYVELGKGGKM
jgi:transposase